MGIAENGFRELTNSKHEVKTLDDMKNLKDPCGRLQPSYGML